METAAKTKLEMHALLLCVDVQFVGITRTVLNQLQVTPKIVADCDTALACIAEYEFDVIIVDWREIENLRDFLLALRRSKLNQECVVTAIVRDLMDLRQAFTSEVQFFIHKPASAVQIERCLRASYCATIVRRRKQHRELVSVVAATSTRNQPFAETLVVNLSEGGVCLSLRELGGVSPALELGEEIDVRFVLPGTGQMVHPTGIVIWKTSDIAGIRFSYVPHGDRALLDQWLTECVERRLAESCERLRAS